MRIYLFSFLLLSFSFCSCKKSYKYVEVVDEESILGGTETKEKEAKSIEAANDSSAYLEAYENFCISLKVNKDMVASLGKTYSTPKSFKLYNDKGADITYSVFFANKAQQEKEIAERIFSMKNSLRGSLDTAKGISQENSAGIDSAKIKALIKDFRQKKDEYSNDNKIWYHPKSSPLYTNDNGIYCYFCTENGVAENLRFRLQYYADEWLFFKSVNFSIDGKAYQYIPMSTETDSGNGGYIWEWFDESLSGPDKDLINALSNAQSAKMKLIGRQYYQEKIVTKSQITAIRQTLELYKAMGGQY